MQKLIDSISGIDLTAVQPEQLCRKHGTFRCNSTGSGRDKKYSYRHGASTPIGDIEDSVWKTAAEAVVKRDGLEQEVTQILPYGSSRNRSDELLKMATDPLYAAIRRLQAPELGSAS